MHVMYVYVCMYVCNTIKEGRNASPFKTSSGGNADEEEREEAEDDGDGDSDGDVDGETTTTKKHKIETRRSKCRRR